jgi:asparagine synthase (glutamine-hydrolysing)
MPGIIGKIYPSSPPDTTEMVSARSSLKYHDWYHDSEIWTDRGFACTHTGTGIPDAESYPVKVESIFAWIDGECFNAKEVSEKLNIKATGFASLLCLACKQNLLESALKLLDGVFAAVLYDKVEQSACLITDRYGSRPFYLWQEGTNVAWSSEVKGFFALTGFDKKIDPVAATCFLQFGHLLGTQTWFKNVQLIPAATIIHLDLTQPSAKKQDRYWTWSEVPVQPISFEEAVDSTVRLVRKAVEKCYSPGLKTGLMLSGGIDSRLILAALPEGASMPLFTFGEPRSDDMVIAAALAEKVKMPHHILPLTRDQWWESRPKATWQTDGMVNAFHLHNTVHHDVMKRDCDIVLNGHSINLGGYLITRYNRRVDEVYARRCFGAHASLTGWEEAYFDINRQGPYFLEAVIRHKSLFGGVNFAKTIEMRRPFLDNDLLGFVYGLPDQYRANYRLYLHVALRLSPELFGEFPWQKTGLSLKHTRLNHWFLKLKIKEIRNRLGIQRASFPIADYANWIRQPTPAKYFTDLLEPRNALYPEFIQENFLANYLQPHLERKGNFIEKIGRAATMEWWLRPVFTRS